MYCTRIIISWTNGLTLSCCAVLQNFARQQDFPVGETQFDFKVLRPGRFVPLHTHTTYTEFTLAKLCPER